MALQDLRNFQVFADGFGLAGKANCTPPKLVIKTEAYRTGGMDMEQECDLGMELMELGMELHSWTPIIDRVFGKPNTVFTIRGALRGENDAVIPIKITCRGFCKEIDNSDMKGGEKTERTAMISLNLYRYEYDGQLIHDIDPENMVRVIDGVDTLAETRAAIGM